MIRRPPRPPLFPSPTLFRSWDGLYFDFGFRISDFGFRSQLGDLRHRRRVLVLEIAEFGDLAVPFLDERDRKSTRLNSSHGYISYAVFCFKKKTRRVKATLSH